MVSKNDESWITAAEMMHTSATAATPTRLPQFDSKASGRADGIYNPQGRAGRAGPEEAAQYRICARGSGSDAAEAATQAVQASTTVPRGQATKMGEIRPSVPISLGILAGRIFPHRHTRHEQANNR